MHRTKLYTIAPLVLVFALLAGCSDMLSNPSPVAPQVGPVRSDAPKAERRKDHKFKTTLGALYLDDTAMVLHDGEGKERRLTAEDYEKTRRHFAKDAAIGALYDRLKADEGFKSCLKDAKRDGHLSRVVIGKSKATTSLSVLAPNLARLSLAPASGPSRVIEATDPTFCQEVAMGLYEANARYERSRKIFEDNLLWALGGGLIVGGTSVVYDPAAPFALWGAATGEVYAYQVSQTYVELGIWASWFNLGHCGANGAQYGYTDPSGGGGGWVPMCVQQDVTLEISLDGGMTWNSFYAGTALVCT